MTRYITILSYEQAYYFIDQKLEKSFQCEIYVNLSF